MNEPLPEPIVVPLSDIQAALLLAFHAQPAGAVTVTVPLPPAAPTALLPPTPLPRLNVAQGLSYFTETFRPAAVMLFTVSDSGEYTSDQVTPGSSAPFAKLFPEALAAMSSAYVFS